MDRPLCLYRSGREADALGGRGWHNGRERSGNTSLADMGPRAGFLFGMECAVGRPASRVGRAGSVRSLKGREGLAQPTMGGSLSPIRVTFELHVPDGTWGLTDIAEVG